MNFIRSHIDYGMCVRDCFRSLCFDAGVADDFAPLFMVRDDKRTEIGDRHRHRNVAEIGNTLPDPRIGKT
jgi:hypothetical protein